MNRLPDRNKANALDRHIDAVNLEQALVRVAEKLTWDRKGCI